MEQVTYPAGWYETDDRETQEAPRKIVAPGIFDALRALNAEKDAHRAECPMGQCGRISTLCMCAELDVAEKEAQEEEEKADLEERLARIEAQDRMMEKGS